ncbi:MAG: hypothetical protein RLY31_3254 [Bacteroidota bacterium]|jgi:1-acyl-sn-glycerol-3-phosphate acyltransferase
MRRTGNIMKKRIMHNTMAADKQDIPADGRRSDLPIRWLFPRDPFGNILFVKRMLTGIIGIFTYPGVRLVNRTRVSGMEHLHRLPMTDVLFVSNHQTYFADVILLFHIFSASKWGLRQLDLPCYLLWPRARNYYIAAEETMLEGGWLPRLFTYAGAVTIRRNWRRAGQDIQGHADLQAPLKIRRALSCGWVITFPQGTTTPDAPVRKGTANIIKSYQPLVVPVRIDGLRQAFGKKGLRLRKPGSRLSVSFLPPVRFDPATELADIQQFLEDHLLLSEPKSATTDRPPSP